jgi:hypothetical protein
MKAMHFFNLLVTSNILFFAFFSQAKTSALVVKTQVKMPNTCAELQNQANKASWRHKMIFEGFENLPMQTEVTLLYAGRNIDRLCQLGYITKITPQGKEVCQGFIYTRTNSDDIQSNYGYFRPNLHSPVNNKSDFCRYVN